MTIISDRLLGYRRISHEGIESPERRVIDFRGGILTVEDDAINGRTIVTLGGDYTPITQAHFYVDWTNGVDTNPGDSAARPIKTFERMDQILSRGSVDGRTGSGVVSVHVLSDSAENIELHVRGGYGGVLKIYDDRAIADRAIGSYAISARTSWDDGERNEVYFSCSGLPTSIAALPDGGGVGYQAIISASATPAHVGASTWVIAETSAKTALCPGWYKYDLFDTTTVSAGDTVSFCRLRKLSGSVTVAVEGNMRVEFQDLEIGVSGSAYTVSVTRGSVYFVRSLVHGVQAGGNIYSRGLASVALLGSRAHNGCQPVRSSNVILLASACTRSVTSAFVVGGDTTVLQQNLIYGNPAVVSELGYLLVDVGGSLSIYGNTVGVEAAWNSFTEVRGVLWGKNITSVFLNLYTFAKIMYAPSALAIAGTAPTFALQHSGHGVTSVSLTLPFNASTNTSVEAL